MTIIIYSSEADMPKHLQSQKQPEWNILDRMDWDTYNFVPTDYPQKSLFHNHNTWNSHRTDYFNLMNIKIAEKEATDTRIKIENKMGTTASYSEELKQAEEEEKIWEAEEAEEERQLVEAEKKRLAEEAEAMELLQSQLTYTNTVIQPFVKQTPEERASMRKIQNRKTYLRKKAGLQKANKEASYVFCDFCGGEFKDTAQGHNNHQLSQIHTTKVLRDNICKYYMNKHDTIKTMERAEKGLDNLIKESEKSLTKKYTAITLKNKYKRLWAQYSSTLSAS